LAAKSPSTVSQTIDAKIREFKFKFKFDQIWREILENKMAGKKQWRGCVVSWQVNEGGRDGIGQLLFVWQCDIL